MSVIAKRNRTTKALLRIPVRFKNLSIGDQTTTLGFSVARDRLNVDAAEQAFCGKRLKVRILIGAGTDPDQGILWDDVTYDVEGIADAKKFSVTPKLISSGLCFNIDGVDIEELAHFAKRDGVVLITKIAEADDDQDDEEDME
jgi:hypothetical protein